MEYMQGISTSLGRIKCCDCDSVIEPNPTNMCPECLRRRVDITESIPKEVVIYSCKGCERFLNPPEQWIFCALESRELLSFCLKKLKGLKQVHLVDANFIWTEPHSKRIKVKLTVQKEEFGVILQQEVIIEYVVHCQMCNDCHKREAKNMWKASVQLRQKVQHKKTFFYLEQLILKYQMHQNCVNIKASNVGLDFFFAKKDDARKMVDFFTTVVPCRYITSQQLISHNTHDNTFDYKYTFSVEIVPVCKDDVVCLPLMLARKMGNINQVCVCYKVTSTLYLIDPCTLQTAEISAKEYWRTPFFPIGSLKQYKEYTVMDITHIQDNDRITFVGQGHLSHKHVLSDVWVVRSSELGVTDSLIHSRTHLGHILKPGDTVLGLDLSTINVNNIEFNKLNKEYLSDAILVKKVYEDRSARQRRRKWKLKHLNIDANSDTSSIERDYDDFLQELEEDTDLRRQVNVYKDPAKIAIDSSDFSEDVPHITLQDMMDDLNLDEDATGEEGGAMIE